MTTVIFVYGEDDEYGTNGFRIKGKEGHNFLEAPLALAHDALEHQNNENLPPIQDECVALGQMWAIRFETGWQRQGYRSYEGMLASEISSLLRDSESSWGINWSKYTDRRPNETTEFLDEVARLAYKEARDEITHGGDEFTSDDAKLLREAIRGAIALVSRGYRIAQKRAKASQHGICGLTEIFAEIQRSMAQTIKSPEMGEWMEGDEMHVSYTVTTGKVSVKSVQNWGDDEY